HCAKGGDVIDLVRHVDNVSVAEAVAILTSEHARPTRAATAAPAAKVNNVDDERQRLEAAHRVWRGAVGLAGTAGAGALRRPRPAPRAAPRYGSPRARPP